MTDSSRPTSPLRPAARPVTLLYAAKPPSALPDAPCCQGGACCTVPPPAPELVVTPAGAQTAQFHIAQMDCPVEERLIRSKLAGMPGIAALQFNLLQRVLIVHHTLIDAEAIAALVQPNIASLGMKAVAVAANVAPPVSAPAPWWPLAAAGALALGAEISEWFAAAPHGLSLALALAAIALGGLGTYKKGWIALRYANLNINALMSIAVTGALLLGQWPEAAMVMVLFAIAERIEAASLARARNAVRGLLAMTPQQATLQQTDGSWLSVEAKSVVVGALVLLRPGERVPLDGIVSKGNSSVDQAPITGESLPVEKAVGDTLFAGSINQEGELEFRVTAKADDSTLARIIHIVETAQASRAPSQRFVDKFASIYTPVIFALALLVAILPPLLFDGLWAAWAYKALVLLVIACPCALVISTPVTVVSGLAAAASHGILIKGGVHLEQGRQLEWLALDKTGTLTEGKPRLTDVELIDASADNAHVLAASLAARSDHPVSKAIATAEISKATALLPVEGFSALAGRGVQGRINGRDYILGNHTLIHDLGFCSAALEAKLALLEQQGKTTVLLAQHGNGVLALFAVADTVKETSRAAVAALHDMGIKTLMLSGDNPHTVEAIAATVGIDRALGNQLPQDKAAAITQLTEGGSRVGMVGDGINDAPALASASIGFAMGAAGTDTAIETADVVLMDDDLRKIPTFIRLSRATNTTLKQNITLALGIKAVFLALTLMGSGTMWMAVFADMGASLLVVFNSLRMLRR